MRIYLWSYVSWEFGPLRKEHSFLAINIVPALRLWAPQLLIRYRQVGGHHLAGSLCREDPQLAAGCPAPCTDIHQLSCISPLHPCDAVIIPGRQLAFPCFCSHCTLEQQESARYCRYKHEAECCQKACVAGVRQVAPTYAHCQHHRRHDPCGPAQHAAPLCHPQAPCGKLQPAAASQLQ